MNHTKSFECTICQIVYSTKQALKNHTAFVHEKLGHLCSLCGKTFQTISEVKNHVKVVIQQNFKYFILNSSVNNVLWNLKPKEKEKGAICRK